jgi:NAD-dependent deacetylase sirtuin 1
MDASEIGQGSNHSCNFHRICSSVLETAEPERKKRCIRFASDLSAEDPLLVADSGFGELSASSKFEDLENGVPEVSSFFSVDGQASQLFEDANHPLCGSVRTTSIDTLSLHTEVSDLPDRDHTAEDEDKDTVDEKSVEELLNNGNIDTFNSSTSSSRSSSSASGNNSSSDDTWGEIFANPEIAGNSSRTLMMQRFLSQFRSNPNDAHLQHFLALLLSGPEFAPARQRLRHVTTISDAARLLRCSKKILVLTGAGISVSCGIPDFRSKDGLYSRVSKIFPDLRDPQSIFDIRLFRRDPRPFFLTAKELYPGQFEPSLSHKFIKKLEDRGQLLRNYSQNIDTLEKIAGIERVTMCHGSFATATCIRCRDRVNAEDIKEKVLAGEVPFCTKCSTPEEISQLQFPLGEEPQSMQQDTSAERRESFDDEEDYYTPMEPVQLPPVLKPDIVFFGEDLPDEFHNNLQTDKPDCDLLLVIGSSLRVRPVSLIPGMLPATVPQILINRESLPHCRFDVELLGNCDEILTHLSRSMGSGFNELSSGAELVEIDKLPKEGVDVSDNALPVPQSEHDIQALKSCWEPKVNENISERLPQNSYLSWRPRQYIFEGAEELYDPDEDESEDSDNESNSSSHHEPLNSETPATATEAVPADVVDSQPKKD